MAGGIGGPRTAQYRDPGSKRMVLEFKGTGAQVVVPPSIWTGDGGPEVRVWQDREGRPAPVPDEPATVDCRLLFDRAHELATSLGGRPAPWVESLMRPAAAEPVAVPAVRPREGGEPRRPTPGGVFCIPPADRIDVARIVIERMPSAKWSRRALDHLLPGPHPRQRFALAREPALELLSEYNCRLSREGEEVWSDAELAHKIDSALAAATDPRFPYGCKVRAEAVTNPHRLAREFLADRTVRYWRDLYWEYDGTKYVQVADREMKVLLTGHVERRFAEEYPAQVARYERRMREWLASPTGDRPAPPTVLPVRAPLVRDVTLALNDRALLRATYPMPCMLPEGASTGTSPSRTACSTR